MTRLPELPVSAVPAPLAVAVADWAMSRNYAEVCLRFFDGGDVFVVAAPSSCMERTPQPDHFEITAFRSDGTKVDVSISDYWDEDLRVEPLWRLRQPCVGSWC